MEKKMDKNSSTIELHLPSRLGYEKIAMNTAASTARLMGFADERIEDLKTAIAEACINAMEHGNKLDESLRVGVILCMSADSLEVKVLDTGPGPQHGTTTPNIDKKCMKKRKPAAWGCFSFSPSWTKPNGLVRRAQAATRRMVIHLHHTNE